MAGRNRHDSRLVKELKKLESPVDMLWRPHLRQVQPTREQAWEKAYCLVLEELHGDVGSALTEVMEEHRHQTCRCGVDSTELEGCCSSACAFSEALGQGIGLGKQVPRSSS